MDSNSQIGFQSEVSAIAALVMRGHNVFVPLGPPRHADFVVEREGRIQRVQCRTGRVVDNIVRFTAFGARYNGTVEAFVVFCPELDKLYWIPLSDVEPKAKWGKLRLELPKQIHPRRGKMAADYEI